MDTKERTIKYLNAELNRLMEQREKLNRSLNSTESAITSISQTIEHLESCDQALSIDDLSEEKLGEKGNCDIKPNSLKLTRFKGMKLADVIEQVFKEHQGLPIMSIEALISKIYAASNEEEEKACKASLIAALHRIENSDSSLVSRVESGIYRFKIDDDEALKIAASYKKEVA